MAQTILELDSSWIKTNAAALGDQALPPILGVSSLQLQTNQSHEYTSSLERCPWQQIAARTRAFSPKVVSPPAATVSCQEREIENQAIKNNPGSGSATKKKSKQARAVRMAVAPLCSARLNYRCCVYTPRIGETTAKRECLEIVQREKTTRSPALCKREKPAPGACRQQSRFFPDRLSDSLSLSSITPTSQTHRVFRWFLLGGKQCHHHHHLG